MPDTEKTPPRPQKPNHIRDGSPDVILTKDVRDPNAPEFKVTFERPESIEALKSAAAKTEKTETKIETKIDVKQDKAHDKSGALALVDEKEAVKARDTSSAYDSPALMGGISTPVLAIVAASVLAAGWSFTKLQDVRRELATVTDAKVAAERTLTEVQTRLTTAEKAINDVKAAITAATAGTAAVTAPATAEPAKAAAATPEAPKVADEAKADAPTAEAAKTDPVKADEAAKSAEPVKAADAPKADEAIKAAEPSKAPEPAVPTSN